MPDFAVRVRGAKGRSWRSPRRLVAVYLGLWVFALVVFLLMDPTDAMGYALLFHWLLLPIAAFVISLRTSSPIRRDGRMWLLPLALGLLYMLADFLTFRVTFQAGERVVDTVEVPYGGSLDPAAFPEVPSDGGRYGAWAPFDHNHITRSLTVEAVYEDWVTTISSGGERPLLLAEGAFSPDARLELAQRPEPVDGAAAYDYQITDGAELPDTVTLRVCADGLRGSVRAALLQDGSAVPIEAERDGSYLVLTAPTAGTLLLSASGSGTLLPWVLAAAAAAVLLALLFLRRRRKKTNAAASV